MELQLKHILPYFPYDLGIEIINYKSDYVGLRHSIVNGYYFIGDKLHVSYKGGATGKDSSLFKPILRPISEYELTKVLSTSMGNCNILDYISTSKKDSQLNARLLLSGKCDQLEQWKFERLVEQLFDVFSLIPARLAIDKNTLKNEESEAK